MGVGSAGELASAVSGSVGSTTSRSLDWAGAYLEVALLKVVVHRPRQSVLVSWMYQLQRILVVDRDSRFSLAPIVQDWVVAVVLLPRSATCGGQLCFLALVHP